MSLLHFISVMYFLQAWRSSKDKLKKLVYNNCMKTKCNFTLVCVAVLFSFFLMSALTSCLFEGGDLCDGITCSEHEVCSDAVCICDTGYTGHFCDNCAAGYHMANDECIIDTCITDSDCNTNGGCVLGKCVCDEGYIGTLCDACNEGYHVSADACVLDACELNLDCNDNGECISSECTCYAGYSGTLCGECAESYHEENDQCVVDECSQAADCNNHGACTLGVCVCDAGYIGDLCDSCATDYHEESGGCLFDMQDSDIIGNYIDAWGDAHEITSTAWTMTSVWFGTVVHNIFFVNNEEEFLVTQETVGGTWSRFDWTFYNDNTYYCQIAFWEPTQEAAQGNTSADRSNPEVGGCGAFAWTNLTPP
ncbi:MAG: hypothetical protein ABH871_09040 [Pseudomonadota bacterium]